MFGWHSKVDGPTPWLDDKRWHGGRLRPMMGGLVGQWFGALMLLGVGLLIVGVEREVLDLSKPQPVHLALLFPIIGLLMLVRAMITSVRFGRFRRVCLQMQSMPAPIGGEFRADLDLPAVEFRGPVQITLLSQRRHISRSSSRARVRFDTLWQDSVAIDPARGRSTPFGLTLPVVVAIPPTCRDERSNLPDDMVRWMLQVRGPLAGADLELSFLVPVYRLGPEEQARMLRRPSPRDNTSEDAMPATVRMVEMEGTKALETRVERSWVDRLAGWAVVACLMAGVIVAISTGTDWLSHGVMGAIFGVLLNLGGLVLALIALASASYQLTVERVHRVWSRPDGVHVQRGEKGKVHRLAAIQEGELTPRRVMRTQHGDGQVVERWSVRWQPEGKGKRPAQTLAVGLKSEREAQWVIRWLGGSV